MFNLRQFLPLHRVAYLGLYSVVGHSNKLFYHQVRTLDPSDYHFSFQRASETAISEPHE